MSIPPTAGRQRSNPIAGVVRGLGLLVTGAGLVFRRARLFGLGLIPPLITSLLFLVLFVISAWLSQRIAVWVTPFADGWAGFFGRAVPIRSRYVVRPRRPHSAASSSTRRTGSVGSAKIAVPTWTATAPTARKSRTSSRFVTPPMATTGILTAWAAS